MDDAEAGGAGSVVASGWCVSTSPEDGIGGTTSSGEGGGATDTNRASRAASAFTCLSR
jgi:hypothetical protein